MPLIYDDASHSYAWKSRKSVTPIPSVTQILARAGISDHTFVPQEALQRGTNVHKEIEILIRYDLKDKSVRFSESLRLKQARKFLYESKTRIVTQEEIVFNRDLWYVGRLDCIAVIDGVTWLLDWKCNTLPKSVGPQLAAYKEAWNATHKRIKIQKVGAVVLKEDSYQLIDSESSLWPTDHRTDWQRFKTAHLDQCARDLTA